MAGALFGDTGRGLPAGSMATETACPVDRAKTVTRMVKPMCQNQQFDMEPKAADVGHILTILKAIILFIILKSINNYLDVTK
jgi:hypothetical protein